MFGKKKPKVEEATYEIFGGFTINKIPGGYEIVWRSPNLTTIEVFSLPIIDDDVQVEREGDTIHVASKECKLKLVREEETTKVFISKI